MRKLFFTAACLLLVSSPAFAVKQALTSTDTGAQSRTKLNANFTELYTKMGELFEGRPWLVQSTAPADTTILWFDTTSSPALLKRHNGTAWEVVAGSGGETYSLPTASAETLGGIKVGARLTITDGVLSADVQATDISGKQDTLVSGANIKTVNNTSLLGEGNITIEGGEDYTLPVATSSVLGGVKEGDRITIAADGTISADVQATDISGKENSLGNPSTNGYVLSSTTLGVRSWIEMTGGGTGISHATSDGSYYGSRNGGWTNLGTVFHPLNGNTTGSAGSISISGQTGLLSFTGLTSTNRVKTVRNAADTILEQGGAYTPTGAWNWTSATGSTWPTFNQNTTGTSGGLTAQYIDWNSSSGGSSIANKPSLGTVAQYNVGTGANNIPQLNSSGELPYTIPQLTSLQTASGITSGDTNLGTFTGSTIADGSTIKGALQSLETAVEGAGGGGLSASDIDTSAKLRSILTDEVGTGAAYFVGGALGTPASVTLTNGTGLPVSGITGSTSVALGLGSIELGHASDTTIARSGAGAITVEGVGVALNSTSVTHTAGTIELGAATDTTLGRVAAGRISVEDVELQKQPTSNGLVARTAAGTAAARTITGTANQITVTNGDGVSGNPTLTIPQDIHTAATPQFAGIEVGNASDTTLSRAAAGRLAVEGVDIITTSSTDTLTNKTINTAATGNNITVPLNGVLDGAITKPADADDMIYIKAQNAMTITDIHCIAEGGGTITITLQECSSTGGSCANIEGAITCDADGAEDDGTLTDGAIAAGAWIKVLFGAPSGTVNSVAWSVYGTQTW